MRMPGPSSTPLAQEDDGGITEDRHIEEVISLLSARACASRAGSYLAATGVLRRAWSENIKNDPRIEYPARLDLGNHEVGEIAITRFTIANRGGGELVIDDIHSNCSCTGMEREQDGRYGRVNSLRLKAGEQANLVMRVSVRGVPIGAEMLNAVEFQTNDPDRPTGRIEAVVRFVSGGVSATPQSIIFGTVPSALSSDMSLMYTITH